MRFEKRKVFLWARSPHSSRINERFVTGDNRKSRLKSDLIPRNLSSRSASSLPTFRITDGGARRRPHHLERFLLLAPFGQKLKNFVQRSGNFFEISQVLGFLERNEVATARKQPSRRCEFETILFKNF